MGVTTTQTNKPLNPRGNDQSPLAFNRAKLFSGKALSFDGVNDVVTISDNAALDFGTSDFSIAFTMDSSVAGYGRILDKRSGTNGYTLSIGTSKELVLELNDGTGSSGFFTSSIYADGKLKHVVVSADRDGNASFYINGALDETIDISSKSGNLDSTSDLFIGADAPSGNSLYYNGSIAGFKIFNTALTAAQVADLYNNPEKVVPTGVDNTALKLWLPMQEGAGTTAYDGSGNGNHGTISGATYVHGIGAPVSQTAVIDWNKGTNLVAYSEQFDNAFWSKVGTLTANANTSPDGYLSADKLAAGTSNYITRQFTTTIGTTYTSSVYIKSANAGQSASLRFNLSAPQPTPSVSISVTTTDQWQRVTATFTATSTITFFQIGEWASLGYGPTNDILVWGAQCEAVDSLGPYIPTLSTAQTSEVLLPQGLTTGRDITGVNLFENVRKQGALNLDGNSWAEVHDNASLDVTTGLTLEAWVYWDGSSAKGIFGRWDLVNNKRSYLLYTSTPARFNFFVSSNGTLNTNQQNNTDISTGWNHIAGVYDGANIITYLNGSSDGSKNYSSDIYANDVDIEIGRYDLNSANAYPNAIAQPRIYNRALTAEEVARNYNNAKSIYTNS